MPSHTSGTLPRLIIALLGFCSTTVSHASAWELIRDEAAIQVFARAVPGSKIKALKGITHVQAPLAGVVALLQDAEANIEWVYHSGGVRVLQQVSEREAYVYAITEAPWPISDRDAVIRFSLQQNPHNRMVTITMSGHPDYLAPQQSYVRMPVFEGFWQLTPLSNGRVEIVCQLHAEPGGFIPDWLANSAAQKAAYQTLVNLRNIISRQKYQNATLNFIQEPP
ncbi:MAG: START domain-containing protein [Candidatus Competibacteraceae bacterium]|nr:START domain-containing protein [Candidatus Competibacteraceae bacterium]